MKALSVRQPFAELIASGRKTIEVRSRNTRHRGPLLICGATSWHKLGVSLHGQIGTRGVSVCLVDVVDSRPLTADDLPRTGLPLDFDVRCQFAWVLSGAQRLAPIPVSGRLGLFDAGIDVRLAGT